MAHNHATLINIVAACSWPEKEGTKYEGTTVEDRPQQELLDLFVDWEQEVKDILKVRAFQQPPLTDLTPFP